ncbi:MAG: hypothetical protein JSU61_08750, partial [Fidelibacterota bacterium]
MMARYMGTWSAVLGLVILMVGAVMGQGYKSEVREMFTETEADKPELVTEADLDGLPEPVQRYLRYTGVVGKERIRVVRLKQRGQMRIG